MTVSDGAAAATRAAPVRPLAEADAAAAVASRLSFARAAMRDILEAPWQLKRVSIDLDAAGRGEALYRFCLADWTFHFFVISQDLPEDQKLDRNFAASWDIMAVLCEGAWTPEREAYLRRQVPLQRAGRADIDTLIYARGNRSGRLFGGVVEALAAGRQPDIGTLARVGYIVRTTAFIGNGQLGTRPFAGYDADHPFRAPYHAQMAAGFLLREFVYDLVDEMAAARSPDAVPLAPEIRRFLGLGNSAATGLVPFLVNHPRLVGDWIARDRAALADVCGAALTPAVRARVAALLDKAVAFLADTDRPDDGAFAPDGALAAGLARARGRIASAAATTVGELRSEIADDLGPDVGALFDAILLDALPDVADRHARRAPIDEQLRADPRARTVALHAAVEERYGWALEASRREGSGTYFWYRASGAPRDLRRGLTGRQPAVQFETAADVVPRVAALAAGLRAAGDVPLAEFLADRPELRHIAARVAGLAEWPHGELAVDLTDAGLSPFAPVRLVLSLFGLDQYEAAPPKSVRGTFLQGAPTGAALTGDPAGSEDEAHAWPFPQTPRTLTAGARPVPDPGETRFAPAAGWRHPKGTGPDGRATLTVAPIELERGFMGLMQSAGLSLGVAEVAAELATQAVVDDPDVFATLIGRLEAPNAHLDEPVALTARAPHAPAHLEGRCAALAAAPAALDLAAARVTQVAPGVVVARVGVGSLAASGPAIAAAAARRGLLGLVALNDGKSASLIVATPVGGSVATSAPQPLAGPAAAALLGGAIDPAVLTRACACGSEGDSAKALPRGLVLACLLPQSEAARTLRAVLPVPTVDPDAALATAQREGVVVSEDSYLALERLAARLYVTPDIEPMLRDEPIDPLTMF